MPVRSLSSSVLRWPDRQAVDRAVREWAARLADERLDVIAIGYFGSYARGDWGVGSDVDLVVVLAKWSLPFERRAAALDAGLTAALPVPADLLVYTSDEWQHLTKHLARRRLGLRNGRPSWMICHLRQVHGCHLGLVLESELDERRPRRRVSDRPVGQRLRSGEPCAVASWTSSGGWVGLRPAAVSASDFELNDIISMVINVRLLPGHGTVRPYSGALGWSR